MTALGERGPVVGGARPAGALLAVYLARQGHDVIVYESRPDMRHVDISAGPGGDVVTAGAERPDDGDGDRDDACADPCDGSKTHYRGAVEFGVRGPLVIANNPIWAALSSC